MWHREQGTWKIVAWYLDNPLAQAEGPQLVQREANEAPPAAVPEDPDLASATERFLTTWLVSRNFTAALKQVAPEAHLCANLSPSEKGTAHPSTLAWFEEIAAKVPKSTTLNGAIQSVEFSHPQMQEVHHRDKQAYTLARISDALAAMYSCSARNAGEKPGPADAIGKAYFTLDEYQTMFQPRHTSGDRGTVVLTWARRQNRWMVVAFDVVTY